MNTIYFYLYGIIAFLISFYITIKSRSKHKFITLIICYWILAGYVSMGFFTINLKLLPFDLHIHRLIFLVFSIYLIRTRVMTGHIYKNKHLRPKFEKYLYLYFLVNIVSILLHSFELIIISKVILEVSNLLTFLVIYLVLKMTGDKGMIIAFGRALIIVCIISSIVGIFQFFVNPLFFRIYGTFRAFGENYRSSGVFAGEYIQGYFLLSGIVVILLTSKNVIYKYSLLVLFLIGIILSFHRGCWIITLLMFSLFLFLKQKKSIPKIALGLTITLGILMFIQLNFSPMNINKTNPFMTERLTVDTVGPRLEQFSAFTKAAQQNWLVGFGTSNSDMYYYTMLKTGMDKEWARGEKGAIHNLYVGMMFFYGVPVLILFLLFIFFVSHHFWILFRNSSKFYFLIIVMIFIFFMANMSNYLTVDSYLGLFLAIYLGIGMAAYNKNFDLSDIIKNQ